MKPLLLYLLFLLSSLGYAQESISDLLKTYNSESIPYINVQELSETQTDAILLDAREFSEYKVSHLKNAIHVGYQNFNIEDTTSRLKNKQQTIIVYCSLGIRSEDIAEQIKNEGYMNVYNLYGGIFEWKNNNFVVYDENEQPTDKIHAYSEEWSSWLTNGNKIYD